MQTSPRLVYVEETLIVDNLTPLVMYDRLRRVRERSFLLESVEGGERWARYSFIGVGALVSFVGFADRVEVHLDEGEGGHASKRSFSSGSDATALHTMARLLREFVGESARTKGRFGCGAVGYVSWNASSLFEPRLGAPEADEALFRFAIPRVLLRFDLLQQRLQLVAAVDVAGARPDEVASRRESAREAIKEVLEALFDHSRDTLSTPLRPESVFVGSKTGVDALPAGATSTLPERAYMDAVERCKEYIRAGDIIQVVLSQRVTIPWNSGEGNYHGGDVLGLYRHLRLVNPSPYLFLLDFGDEQLVGASPEVLVRKTGSLIEVRPIAGTRRRGIDDEEDRALAEELLADPKEIAEHIMLVDLGRNDVGRISTIGSVKVAEQMVIERYSHVMHIVSHVTGELNAGLDWADTIGSTFPAGTLSGAPKVRAMEIIDELEPDDRGVYGGAVGYVDASGDMDLCITIRTVHVHDGVLDIQAGAGIVADSDPHSEWQETLKKASALIAALRL